MAPEPSEISLVLSSVVDSEVSSSVGFSKFAGTEAMRSTTNTSVSFGPIEPEPDPFSPYANSGGIVRDRRPPTDMPTIP